MSMLSYSLRDGPPVIVTADVESFFSTVANIGGSTQSDSAAAVIQFSANWDGFQDASDGACSLAVRCNGTEVARCSAPTVRCWFSTTRLICYSKALTHTHYRAR